MRRIAFFPVFLSLCGCPDSPPPPPPLPPPVLPEAGPYAMSFVSVDAGDCGLFVQGLTPGAPTLSYPTPNELLWTDSFLTGTQTCSVTEGVIACPGFDQLSLPFRSVQAPFTLEAIASASFEFSTVITVDCQGDDCAAIASDAGARFPCSMTARVHMERTECDDVRGFYRLSDACDEEWSPSNDFACVAQSDCAVRVDNRVRDVGPFGYAAFGSATGTTLSLKSGPERCAGEVDDGALDLTCASDDRESECQYSGQRVAIDNILSPCCDVRVQSDCGPGASCTVVFTATDAPATTACVQTTGDRQEGESCQRTFAGADVVGRDDCAAGLICSNTGSPLASERKCLKLCAGANDCGPGGACFGPIRDSVPAAGNCTPVCTPLGEDCPDGMSCRMQVGIGPEGGPFVDAICIRNGDGGVGAACEDPSQCGADLVCHDGACRPHCNDENPCAEGTCTDIQLTSRGDRAGACL